MDWSIFARTALTEFRIRNHPFQMLTKVGMKAARDFEFYSGQDAFAVTLTFDNEKNSLEWEPRAALPASRIEALQAATWVSFEPVISPEQTFRLYEATKEFVMFLSLN
jgi:DNA repair photolyase